MVLQMLPALLLEQCIHSQDLHSKFTSFLSCHSVTQQIYIIYQKILHISLLYFYEKRAKHCIENRQNLENKNSFTEYMEVKSLPTLIFNLGLRHYNRFLKENKFDSEGQIK